MEGQTQTFASSVKEEIVNKERNFGEKRALLLSFLKLNGHVRLSKGSLSLILDSPQAKIAKYLYSCIYDVYGVSSRFSYTRSAGFLKRVVYHVIVDDAKKIMDDLNVDPLSDENTNVGGILKDEIADYLSGAFLATGSVNDPNCRSYHLEIRCQDEESAKSLMRIWGKSASHSFHPRLSKRRNGFIVYIKSSEEIADFLIFVGAENACFYYEDVRVARDYKNVTNRLINLDAANLSKSLNTGARQIEEIKYLEETGAISKLKNPKTEIICRLRKENPDMPLSELAKLLSEEIASSVSKSNVNHLFREIHQLYEKERQ